MLRLISTVRPFDYNQTVSLYDDEKLICKKVTSFKNIEDTLMEMAESNNITEICLHGPRSFIKKIREDYMKHEISKYGSNKVDIILYS